MSRINTNIPALLANHRLQNNYLDLTIRLHRLSTGLRINRGADDPAGLIASEIMRSEIRNIQQAIDNSGRASNVISVAEGALNEVSSLLLDLQALTVEAANEAGLSESEVRANQLQMDSILATIDRIANTTNFAGRKLVDGSQAYLTTGVPVQALPSVQLFAAQVPHNGSRAIHIQVTQSAQTAQVAMIGANATGTSVTSATTIELRGSLGAVVLSFASGTSMAQIRDSINIQSVATGVMATVSSVAAGSVASALVLTSIDVGSDQFVSVQPISGNFVVTGNGNTTIRNIGVDAGVLVNGQPASVQGLRADVRGGGLDARFFLSRSFGQVLSSADFTITGGGALFQLTPEVSPNGQINVGFGAVSTTQLGNPVTGLLYSLRSGAANDLLSKNFQTAQQIVEEAINEIAFYRGRLGSIQKDHIEPNIDSQRIALENVTASESIIRDADMAEEISAMTRSQILIQSTQSTLQIANSLPNLVLSLLG